MNYTAEEIENLCVLLESTKIDAQIVRNYIYGVLQFDEILYLNLEPSQGSFEFPDLDFIDIDELYKKLYLFNGDDDYEYYPTPYKCGIDEQTNYDYVHLEYMQNYYPKCVDDSHLSSWHQILPTFKHKRLWIEDGLSIRITIVDPSIFKFIGHQASILEKLFSKMLDSTIHF